MERISERIIKTAVLITILPYLLIRVGGILFGKFLYRRTIRKK